MKIYIILLLSLLFYTCSEDPVSPAVCTSGQYDACSVCDGDDSTCAGCDDVANSGLVNDNCGVCDGDDSTCAGCDDVANSGLVNDNCGVCGGDDSTCAGCDDVANSGLVNDNCGVCGGDDSTCAGCDGVANSGLVNDDCGVCGGDGSSCGSLFDGSDGCTLPDNSIYVVANGDVLYNILDNISGLQWTVDGTTVSGGTGGTSGAAGYNISASGTTFLGFSFTGAVISDDCGVLVNMTLADYSTFTGLSDLVIANTSGGSTLVTYYTE